MCHSLDHDASPQAPTLMNHNLQYLKLDVPLTQPTHILLNPLQHYEGNISD